MQRHTRRGKTHIRVHPHTICPSKTTPSHFPHQRILYCLLGLIHLWCFFISHSHNLPSLCKNIKPPSSSPYFPWMISFQKASSKAHLQYHFPKRAVLGEERHLIPRLLIYLFIYLFSLKTINYFTECIFFSKPPASLREISQNFLKPQSYCFENC